MRERQDPDVVSGSESKQANPVVDPESELNVPASQGI